MHSWRKFGILGIFCEHVGSGVSPSVEATGFQKKDMRGIPGWLSSLAPAFGPGLDPGVRGSSPTSGSLHGACFSLCLCLCLSLYVYHEKINKNIKKKKKRKPKGSSEKVGCGIKRVMSRMTTNFLA